MTGAPWGEAIVGALFIALGVSAAAGFVFGFLAGAAPF